jgi:hypothetical protein
MRPQKYFGFVMVLAALLALTAHGRAPTVPGGHTPDSPPTLADLAWFAGSWETDQNGRHAEEHWMRPAGGTMLGMARTVRGDKTTFFEYLRLESRPDGIFYVAQPQGRPPVDFRLASLQGQEAVFVNPGNEDHLKKIVYRKNADGSLTARVEGEDNGKAFASEWQFQPQAK